MQFISIIFCTFARKSVRVCSRSAINASIMALASLGFAAWLVQEPQTCQPKGCETAPARQLMQASLLSLNRSFVSRKAVKLQTDNNRQFKEII